MLQNCLKTIEFPIPNFYMYHYILVYNFLEEWEDTLPWNKVIFFNVWECSQSFSLRSLVILFNSFTSPFISCSKCTCFSSRDLISADALYTRSSNLRISCETQANIHNFCYTHNYQIYKFKKPCKSDFLMDNITIILWDKNMEIRE